MIFCRMTEEEKDRWERKGVETVYRSEDGKMLFFVLAGHQRHGAQVEIVRGLIESVQGEGKSIAFFLAEGIEDVTLYCHSGDKSTRALELLESVLEQGSMTKGDAEFAAGNISGVMLGVLLEEALASDAAAYFMQRISDCMNEETAIYAADYAAHHAPQIQRFPVYQKKKIPWSFVRTTDIAPAGTHIEIRTLENDTGITIMADADVFIMIGCMGEVYDITAEKFAQSYVETDQVLDIFQRQMMYIPAITLKETGQIIAIDDVAQLCYPRPGASIRAKKLTGRTKVFTGHAGEYFVGKEGDYLAVRLDDPTDLYIIQREIFEQTYEKKEE